MKTKISTLIIACMALMLTSCGTMSNYSDMDQYQDGIYYSYSAAKKVDRNITNSNLAQQTRNRHIKQGKFIPAPMQSKLKIYNNRIGTQSQLSNYDGYYYNNYDNYYPDYYYDYPYGTSVSLDIWGNIIDPWYYDDFYYPYCGYYSYYYPYSYRNRWRYYDPWYYDPWYYDPWYYSYRYNRYPYYYYNCDYPYYYNDPYYYTTYSYKPSPSSREKLSNGEVWGSRNSSYQMTYDGSSSTPSNVSRSYRRDNSSRTTSSGPVYTRNSSNYGVGSSSSSNRTYTRSSSYSGSGSSYSGSSSSYSRSSSGYSRSSSGYSRNGSTYSRSRR